MGLLGFVQRRARWIVGAVVVGLVALLAPPADPAPAWLDRPDPEVVRAAGRFWLYSTNTRIDGRVWNVPVWSSAELDGWAPHGDALPDLGAWAEAGHTWAPGVARVGQRFVLYYTARARDRGPDGRPLQCIGAAIAPLPVGPFRPVGPAPLVCQADLGGSIDANPYVQADGRTWLVWKSDENARGDAPRLWSAPLTEDGLHLVGAPAVLLRADAHWEGPIVENPVLVDLPDGSLVLLYSGGRWATRGYATGWARCAGPAGPCTKVTTRQPWLGSSGTAAGQGGADVVRDDAGSLWIVHHAWPVDRVGYPAGGVRDVVVRPLGLEQGRLVAGPARGISIATG